MIDLTKLTYPERETYNALLKQTEVKKLTVDDFKEHIQSMLFGVVRELSDTPNKESEKNTLLKARIRNYLLLYDLLVTPENIAKQMQKAVEEAERKVGEK